MTEKSRANYFKERRREKRAFYVELEKDKMEKLEKSLKQKNKTKSTWLNEKIDEEISQ